MHPHTHKGIAKPMITRIQQHRRRRIASSAPTEISSFGLLLRLYLLLCCCFYSATPAAGRKGQLELSKDCQSHWRRDPVRIENVYLVCDSPGAYYGGKSAYQNSITCRQGDRAKVALDCTYRKDYKHRDQVSLYSKVFVFSSRHLVLACLSQYVPLFYPHSMMCPFSPFYSFQMDLQSVC